MKHVILIGIGNHEDFSIVDDIVRGIQKTTDKSFSSVPFHAFACTIMLFCFFIDQIQLHGYSMIGYTFKMDSAVSDCDFFSGVHIQIRVSVTVL